MLRDDGAAQALAAQGYVVLDLLDADEVAELRRAWAEILAEHEPIWDPTGMATTVRHPGADEQADAAILPMVSGALASIFDGEEPFLSAYITKRAGSGDLPPHVDWSLVDETTDRTYGCWIALEDISGDNGVLGVVAGSHLLVDFPRSPAEPGHTWVRELVAGGATLTDVPTRAGQAVVFDHRLVHFSAPNRSDAARVVANVGLAPAGRAGEVRQRLFDFMAEGAAAQIDPGAPQAEGEPPEITPPSEAAEPGTAAATADRAADPVDAADATATPPHTSPRRWSRFLRRRPRPVPLADAGATGPPGADDLSRFHPPLLRDGAAAEALRTSGVTVVPGAIAPDVLVALADLYERAIGSHEGTLPEHWFPTGMLEDPRLQQQVHDEATALIAPSFEALLLPGAGQVFTGSFAVKPVGAQSELGMHQDVSMVDERTGYTLNAWIPLERSTEQNGALRFVAGSHRFGNVQRSLAVPWAFNGHHRTMERHGQLLEVEAGDVILFDTAMIHGSPANVTSEVRVALQCLIVPSTCSTEHLLVTADTPPGHIEAHAALPLDHLLGNGVDAPGTPRGVTLRPLIAPNPTVEEFEAWCAAFAHLPVR